MNMEITIMFTIFRQTKKEQIFKERGWLIQKVVKMMTHLKKEVVTSSLMKWVLVTMRVKVKTEIIFILIWMKLNEEESLQKLQVIG